MISEWYHYPILEWVEISGAEFSAAAIAKRQTISIFEVQGAIDRLWRLGLLVQKPNGAFEKSSADVLASAVIPNEGIRNFQKQLLGKAIESLQTQSSKETFVGSETLALSQAGLTEASMILEDCFQKLLACARKQKNRNHVDHLRNQFFQLTQTESKS